ncbi:MAG: CPBP family intramembrane glutamic endopeptidase [Hyphomicrobiaceae bacterium]
MISVFAEQVETGQRGSAIMAGLLSREDGWFAAGGTLGWPATTASPHIGRRLWLICELCVIYIGVPCAMSWAIFSLRVPLFLVLQPILFIFIVYLLWDDTFLMRRELTRGFSVSTFVVIMITFLAVGGAIAVATYYIFPQLFLSFPRYRPDVWLAVMLLYPVLSVIVQELVFRTFYFHRYGPLFRGRMWLAIGVNGAAFGFAHLIFGNAIAILGSGIIGCFLAYRYARCRSFWAVWLEHSLYGCLVFTVGLGGFFFTGISNLN